MPRLIHFHGQEWYPLLTPYVNSSPHSQALLLIPADPAANLPGSELMVSRNLDEAGFFQAEGHIYVKDYGVNEGVLAALTEQGILQPTGRLVPSGYVNFPEAKLLISAADCAGSA